MKRRSFVSAAFGFGTLGGLSALGGCASTPASKARVLVVGGGYGGATAAKYVRLLSDQTIDVTLVEPNIAFVSCPLSNLVLGGSKTLADVTRPYSGLEKNHGVKRVTGFVSAIDPKAKTATLASGETLSYDKLILAPGIELNLDQVEGLSKANADGKVLHAWKAGPETVALRKQLEAMPDGGVYALTIPEAPYRCPPGPYERACQVASYFKQAKPKSKVLILDANQDVTSKGGLFKKVWAEQYKDIVEYRGQHKTTGVDTAAGLIRFDVQSDVKADVINIVPPMRAGAIAVKTGLANSNGRWVGVNYQTFESTAAKDIHVIGDAIQLAPLMPKSGHMANSQAKVAAAAVVAELLGLPLIDKPMLTNTCYSFTDAKNVVHVASVHEYVAAEKTYKTVAGSGGVSTGPTELEGVYANNWAQNIWADTLG